MENLEKKVASRKKKSDIQKVILATIATAGLLSVALVAPGALSALKVFGFKPHRRQQEVIARTRKELIENGYIGKDEKGFLFLTPKGKVKLRYLEPSTELQKKPKKWDGKWRILIFDIQEKKRLTRDRIRHTLNRIGFHRLQNSVWIYPYDCEEYVTLLKSEFKIGKDLLYLIVEEIEDDHTIRKYFNLPTSS